MKTKTNKKPRSLVIKRLENVSKDVFRKHYDLITDLVGDSDGKVPKGRSSGAMLKQLKSMVKQKHQEEFEAMFGSTYKRKSKKKKDNSKHPKSLIGLVDKKATLYRTYKGKEYKAILTVRGIIKLGNKKYDSPSGAARAIVGRSAVNGWTFWYIKDASGEWVRLGEYRG